MSLRISLLVVVWSSGSELGVVIAIVVVVILPLPPSPQPSWTPLDIEYTTYHILLHTFLAKKGSISVWAFTYEPLGGNDSRWVE